MAKYRIYDDEYGDSYTLVDTAKATNEWDEACDWDGNNQISRATRSQWSHETLYRSRKGNYYTVTISQWQGSLPSAEWLSNKDAAQWLMLMGHDLPAELAQYADDICE